MTVVEVKECYDCVVDWFMVQHSFVGLCGLYWGWETRWLQNSRYAVGRLVHDIVLLAYV